MIAVIHPNRLGGYGLTTTDYKKDVPQSVFALTLMGESSALSAESLSQFQAQNRSKQHQHQRV